LLFATAITSLVRRTAGQSSMSIGAIETFIPAGEPAIDRAQILKLQRPWAYSGQAAIPQRECWCCSAIRKSPDRKLQP
jgi:hypothetical protein